MYLILSLNIRTYSSPTSSHSPYGLSKILAENYIFSTLQPSQYLVLRTPQQYSDHFSTPRNFLSSFYYNYLNSKPNIIRRQERFSCASTLEIALYLRDSLLYGRTGVHHCAESLSLTWSSLAEIYKAVLNVNYIFTDSYHASPNISTYLHLYPLPPTHMIEYIILFGTRQIFYLPIEHSFFYIVHSLLLVIFFT